MTDQPKQINFTIVPDESSSAPRTYANFCSIAHTPFDFTLTFCEVMPLSEKEIKEAETQHPGADTELHFKTAFELLVATILSAQSTDARVNMVTPALFKRYPNANAL